MSNQPACPHCGKTEMEPGPRPGILRCTNCRQLLALMANGQYRLWMDWINAGYSSRQKVGN